MLYQNKAHRRGEASEAVAALGVEVAHTADSLALPGLPVASTISKIM
jgi:hypothetical protein